MLFQVYCFAIISWSLKSRISRRGNWSIQMLLESMVEVVECGGGRHRESAADAGFVDETWREVNFEDIVGN
jgi:hypothetical protein